VMSNCVDHVVVVDVVLSGRRLDIHERRLHAVADTVNMC
jgi:hypothetical protein